MRILSVVSSALLGLVCAMGGVAITLLSVSYATRLVMIDAEITYYGYPFPWMSKALGFGDLLQQARSPPTLHSGAFVADFFLYASGLLGAAVVILLVARNFTREKSIVEKGVLPKRLALGLSVAWVGLLLLSLGFQTTDCSTYTFRVVSLDGRPGGFDLSFLLFCDKFSGFWEQILGGVFLGGSLIIIASSFLRLERLQPADQRPLAPNLNSKQGPERGT